MSEINFELEVRVFSTTEYPGKLVGISNKHSNTVIFTSARYEDISKAKEQAELIADSVNNHDRLVAENKALKESFKSALIREGQNHGFTFKRSSEIANEIIDELLEKLK